MSRSRHTDPPRVTARRADARTGMARARVVERRPRQGDIHPVPKDIVEALLVVVPGEYSHGLRLVELRARQGPLGQPYAEYRRGEKTVVIYSVPRQWEMRSIPGYEQRSMSRFGARLERRGDSWLVHWDDLEKLAFWFAYIVLFHELGHHFSDQYHRRRGWIGGRPYREAFADGTARRIHRAFVKRMRSRRRADGAVSQENP